MVVAMAVFSVMDGVSKALTGLYHPLEVTWGRYLFHTLILVPLVIGRGWRAVLRTRHPGLQIARGLLLAASGLAFIAGLARLPMADAAAIGFIAPLLVTGLSIPLLGERVDRGRWFAVLVGFGGVLLVIRPGGTAFEAASLLPVLSAGFWAVALILTRRLSALESSETTLFYMAAVGLAVSTPLLPWVWHSPDGAGWLAMAAMGAVSALGQFLLIRAFTAAGASVLAPLQYSQIVWAITIGYFWFGTLPDLWTGAGAAVIVGSGVAVWHRERFSA